MQNTKQFDGLQKTQVALIYEGGHVTQKALSQQFGVSLKAIRDAIRARRALEQEAEDRERRVFLDWAEKHNLEVRPRGQL